MKKILILILVSTSLLSYAQSKKEESTFLKDSAQILKETTANVCLCVDSISLKGKSHPEITKEIAACIEKHSGGYELIIKMMRQMEEAKASNAKEINITVNDPDLKEHNQYYFDIERLLRDSCPSLKTAIASNDKESQFSVSGDEIARSLYNKGIKAENAEDYQTAIKYFSDAVARDENFAFAWDNLAICYRKIKKYPEAIQAYEKSLTIDPKGIMPRQNLPIAYRLMGNFDKAIEKYKDLIKIAPENAEGYFGAGQVSAYDKQDLETGLDYMCKAYNLYVSQGSPYRSDAEKILADIFSEMKKQNKEDTFYRILKDNNIKVTGK